jgi:hypothetical protein
MLQKTIKVFDKRLRMGLLNVVVAGIQVQRFEWALASREEVAGM